VPLAALAQSQGEIMKRAITRSGLTGIALLLLGISTTVVSADRGGNAARDPGPRTSSAAAGAPLANLTPMEREYFDAGLEEFEEAEGIADGIGPRFNLDGCAGCHLHPAVGGSSPPVNPQVEVATAFGARNVVPSFIRSNGPVREARFKLRPNGTRDGGVHALFVISGRVDDTGGDATGCTIEQPDFETELARNNVIFRIPTPVFGGGLMEHIPDATLIANLASNSTAKSRSGISGRLNRNGNDGTITRFGWKAQVVSLLLFSGEAYNVEMGVSNELFQNERDNTEECQYSTLPNDVTTVDGDTGVESVSAIEKFAFFMRTLAPPAPSLTAPGGANSIARGRQLFQDIGCALCHTPKLQTGDATVVSLKYQDVNLYSDLAIHNMGPGLADNVVQGEAAGDEFRTAPLWGLGQRLFFLHDGRTRDLVRAIREHASSGNSQFGPSEANRVVTNFNSLPGRNQQDLLNFLRSL
jgi:CxxC motif-containing protein (DUF1111 family)